MLRLVRRDPARAADVFAAPIDPTAPQLPSDVLAVCKATGRVTTRSDVTGWSDAFAPDPPSSPTPASLAAPAPSNALQRSIPRSDDPPPSDVPSSITAALAPLEPMPLEPLITEPETPTVQAPWLRQIPPPLPKGDRS